jgi:hypothetical protein
MHETNDPRFPLPLSQFASSSEILSTLGSNELNRVNNTISRDSSPRGSEGIPIKRHGKRDVPDKAEISASKRRRIKRK